MDRKMLSLLTPLILTDIESLVWEKNDLFTIRHVERVETPIGRKIRHVKMATV